MHVTQSRYCANLFFLFFFFPSFLSCFVLVAVLMSHWRMNPFIFHHHRVQIAILSRLGRRRYIFSHRRKGVVSNRPRQKEGGGGGRRRRRGFSCLLLPTVGCRFAFLFFVRVHMGFPLPIISSPPLLSSPLSFTFAL